MVLSHATCEWYSYNVQLANDALREQRTISFKVTLRDVKNRAQLHDMNAPNRKIPIYNSFLFPKFIRHSTCVKFKVRLFW